jgi:hypothetical protein
MLTVSPVEGSQFFEVEVVQGPRSICKVNTKAPSKAVLWQLLELALSHQGSIINHLPTSQDLIDSICEVEIAPNSAMKTQRTSMKSREALTMPVEVICETFKSQYICFRLVEDVNATPLKKQKLGIGLFDIALKFDGELGLPELFPTPLIAAEKVFNFLLTKLKELRLGWPIISGNNNNDNDNH